MQNCSSANPRALVAGLGNVLRGDDGFGPAVIQALEKSKQDSAKFDLIELGIGGLGLVHQLMDGYDMLILVDAVDRGGKPGSLYVLVPEIPDPAEVPAMSRWSMCTDMHCAVPAVAMIAARAAGVLPRVVRIIGCQPAETEVFSTELTPEVRAAVPRAVAAVHELLEIGDRLRNHQISDDGDFPEPGNR